MSEEGIRALESLARIRHNIHSNWEQMWNAEASNHNEFWNYLNSDSDVYINKMLKNAGLPTINLNIDYEDVPTSMDYDFLDDDEKAEYGNDSWRWREESGEYERFADALEGVNAAIENYLANIDKKYGTSYAPTGWARMFSQKDLSLDFDTEEAEDYIKLNRQLARDNANLKELLKIQRELTKLQGKESHGTLFTKSSVGKQASLLMKEFGLPKGKAELTDKLNTFYKMIASENNGAGLTWDTVMDNASGIARWILNQTVKEEISAEAQRVLNDIRGARVRLDDVQKQEVAHAMESYNDYRKSLLGTVTFTNDPSAISLDSQWQEWAELHPEYFDKEMNAADMPMALKDIISNLRNSYEGSLSEENIFSQTRYMAEEIYDTYWNVSTLHTVADKYQKRINELKSKHRQQLDAVKEKETALKQKYQEQRKKERDRRSATVTRNQIKDMIARLTNTLTKPQKNRYIPREFIKPITDFLSVINQDTVGGDERIAKYDELIANAKDIRKKAQYIKSRDYILKQDTKMKERLAVLSVEYSKFKDNPELAQYHNDVVDAMISQFAKDIGDTSLRNMSKEQLEELYTMLKAIDKTVKNAVKVKGIEENISAYQFGENLAKETNAIPKAHSGFASKYLSWMARPETMFDRLGGFKKNSYWNKGV